MAEPESMWKLGEVHELLMKQAGVKTRKYSETGKTYNAKPGGKGEKKTRVKIRRYMNCQGNGPGSKSGSTRNVKERDQSQNQEVH